MVTKGKVSGGYRALDSLALFDLACRERAKQVYEKYDPVSRKLRGSTSKKGWTNLLLGT